MAHCNEMQNLYLWMTTPPSGRPRNYDKIDNFRPQHRHSNRGCPDGIFSKADGDEIDAMKSDQQAQADALKLPGEGGSDACSLLADQALFQSKGNAYAPSSRINDIPII